MIMKIKWYGHASFLITADSGTKIITDPYEPGGYDGALSYGSPPDEADIALVSHDHPDHNYVQGLKGSPEVVKGSGSHTVSGIVFKGITTYHDTSGGKDRGESTIFCFTVDGIKLCHLGDLGHTLNTKDIEQIGEVDVLMIPVGGYFTIDAEVATAVMNSLKPRLVIPMHFKTEKCDFPITTVDDFVRAKDKVTILSTSEIELSQGALPDSTEIWVLAFAL
jgi:L-ascorbate metabolism protein UlaG (beta-lactamase superfamily)